jgi:hypothetical protein
MISFLASASAAMQMDTFQGLQSAGLETGSFESMETIMLHLYYMRQVNNPELLKAAYREIHAGGSSFKAASFFQRTLSSKEIKIKPKVANVPGLQLSDLLAYPAKMRMLEEHGRNKPTTGFTKEVADLIEKKYNRRYANAQVSGYGKIFLA